MAKALIWRGRGVLRDEDNLIRKDQEIPAGLLRDDRIKQLKALGKISDLTSEEERAKIKARALKIQKDKISKTKPAKAEEPKAGPE